MKRILPLYNFKYRFSRIQCCNLKMGGFGLCNVGQKIGKNKPETHYCCFVEGLEEKNPCLNHLIIYSPIVCNPVK